jgi:hypothetical protein
MRQWGILIGRSISHPEKIESLLPSTGLIKLTQIRHDHGEVGGRQQGVGVVVAQDLTGAGEGVLAELAGVLVVL